MLSSGYVVSGLEPFQMGLVPSFGLSGSTTFLRYDGAQLSGAIFSGQIYFSFHCDQCRERISSHGAIYYAGKHYCYSCAGFDPEKQRFHNFREGLLVDTPFVSGTPYGIVADWLDEQGRSEAANYLRNWENV